MRVSLIVMSVIIATSHSLPPADRTAYQSHLALNLAGQSRGAALQLRDRRWLTNEEEEEEERGNYEGCGPTGAPCRNELDDGVLGFDQDSLGQEKYQDEAFQEQKKDVFMSRGWGAGGMPFNVLYLNPHKSPLRSPGEGENRVQDIVKSKLAAERMGQALALVGTAPEKSPPVHQQVSLTMLSISFPTLHSPTTLQHSSTTLQHSPTTLQHSPTLSNNSPTLFDNSPTLSNNFLFNPHADFKTFQNKLQCSYIPFLAISA
uniref:Uncharacterized protein n=1 Tax=Timema cristinae TaxID=61476 RepID=A0A7R9GZ12_TIMCR|nr:unnamed protein product [Timema cristinae]